MFRRGEGNMRYWLLGTLLCALSACGPSATTQDDEVSERPVVALDGAQVSEASARISHGERLTYVLGCRGCHGKDLRGERFYELYASNLTRDLSNYNDSQLETLLRKGVHPTGRDVWAMPSELFQHLSKPDMVALVAYLRTLKPTGVPTGKPLPFEPETKKMIAAGKFKPAAAFVRESRTVGPVGLGMPHELGRYITRVTCAECHGAKLEGGDGTPNLIVAGAYSREEFEKLITLGVPTGGRKLHPLMVGVAKSRFSHLTPHERDALYAYLKARAAQPQ